MSMRPVHIKCVMFERPKSPVDLERSRTVLISIAQCVAQINQIWLHFHPNTPNIEDTDVRYHVEEETDDHFAEEWCDIPTILRQGWGDCDDLACALVAEYRCGRHGPPVEADPLIKWKFDGRRFVYHMLVCFPDGSTRDPSKELGMGDEESYSDLAGFERRIQERRKRNGGTIR